jgi:aspartate aminotransferase
LSQIQKSLIRQIFEGAPGDSINLALGEPDFQKPEWFIDLINANTLNHFAYTPNAGLPEAREAALEINDYNGSVNNICLLCGAEEGLFASLAGIKLALPAEKSEVLAPSPFFLTYPTISRLLGMDFSTYPIPPFCPGSMLESIRDTISEKTAVVIINSPANPSGIMVCDDELHDIEALCESRGIFLLVDEVYRYFGNRSCPVSHQWDTIGKFTIAVSSLTKAFGLPGLRLGWAFTKNEVINQIIIAHQSIAAISPAFSQQLLAAFPKNDYAAWLADNREKTISNREKIMALMDAAGIEYVHPKGAFYSLLKIPQKVLQKMDDVAFAFHLKEWHQILTVPGTAFGEYSKGHLRLSFGGNPDEFPEAIKRIRNGIDDILAM